MRNDTGDPSGLPRYYQLSTILARRIAEGSYPIGAMLPTEIELCEEFDVSRYTVREALRRLTEDGLVRRRQGSGSQVIRVRADGGYVHSMRSLSELFQYAAETRLDILSVQRRALPPQIAEASAGEIHPDWIYLEGVRREIRSDTPIAFSSVFISPRFAAIEGELVGLPGPIYDLIEARFDVKVGDVEQTISAHPITKHAAKALGVSARTWSVQVSRRYVSTDGVLMQISINDHPGERFSYKMNLRRESLKSTRA